MDASLFEYGLTIAQDLDKKFSIDRKFGVLSQRDVPGTCFFFLFLSFSGMTRSVIPLLVKNNVLGITVGQNGGTPRVNVPKIFRWHDPATKKEVTKLITHPC